MHLRAFSLLLLDILLVLFPLLFLFLVLLLILIVFLVPMRVLLFVYSCSRPSLFSACQLSRTARRNPPPSILVFRS
jgi:hypothetical protein